MRLSNENPLDKIPLPAAPAVLVHTDSLIAEIIQGNKDIQRLIKIATLRSCAIVFTPVENPEVQNILHENDLDVANYYLLDNQYIVKSNFIHASFSFETEDKFAEEFQLQNGYTLNDSMLIGNRYFHHYVSNTIPGSTPIHLILDILQVYHVKNKIFRSDQNSSTNQFFYDLISVNKQIPAYKSLVIQFNYLKNAYSTDFSTIENLLQSLSDRMMLMNKSVIELKYQSLKTVSNDASTEIMYHLSYFVILVTGSFDNLAWIINYIYDLGFSLESSNKNKVKLQNAHSPSKKPNELYYKSLSLKAPAISDYLLSEKISCLIDFVYPLRDAIQHRSFIKPLTVTKVSSGKTIPNKLLIWFPDDVRKILQRFFSPASFGFEEDTSQSMRRDYYDIYIFSKKLHAEMIELVNAISTKIILEEVVKVTDEQTEKIRLAQQQYEDNPFVGLGIQHEMAY
jgi:hypothetical protein